MRLILFVVLFFSTSAFAAPFPIPDGGTSLSPEETQRLRGELQGIAQALGVPSAATPAPTPAEKQRTTADVADRALDMLGNMVGSVAASMQKIAPEVWRVMVRQQYAKAIADLIPAFGVLLMSVAYWLVMRKAFPMPEPNARWDGVGDPRGTFVLWIIFGAGLPLVVAVIATGVLIGDTSNSIKYLLNPEFYAVRDLLTLVLNPGALQ